jgi:hypothetical protein
MKAGLDWAQRQLGVDSCFTVFFPLFPFSLMMVDRSCSVELLSNREAVFFLPTFLFNPASREHVCEPTCQR